MSWYQKGQVDSKAEIEGTPKKNVPYVEVPSSSPINVKSSPTSNNDTYPYPSKPFLKTPGEDPKQKELERKRQAIRDHKDFNVVRKRFFYLDESDIFKGFVKGKGNLRDISRWLEVNFDKDAILGRLEAQRRRDWEASEQARLNHQREMLIRDAERSLNAHEESKPVESNEPEVVYDEDNSPVKVKGRAAPKNVIPQNTSPERKSTKVEVNKSKQSILDKYKYRSQPSTNVWNLSGNIQNNDNETFKKRKLVRASNISADTSLPSMSSLTSKFSFYNPQKSTNVMSQKKSEMDEGDDDLEKLEEKIRQNRKASRAKRGKANKVSDDELEEDISEELSDGEEGADSNGLTSMDAQVLDFLNSASEKDLIEISNVTDEIAKEIISQRPFEDIYTISEGQFEHDNKTEAKRKGRGGQRKPMGLKIIENTEHSLRGYKAIESLISKCSEYGNLISDQMKKWGVTATGGGELEVVDIDPGQNGIQEMESVSDEDDSIIFTGRRNGQRYIKDAPSTLAEGIELKSYQLVGLNWLYLLYQNKLSCILADEMGLGKTCQVISFIAHLKSVEENSGPHLVVVPASTIENWLREFNKFCPSLVVQAYHGSQAEREDLRYELEDQDFDVLVTTYNLATGAAPDFKFLRNQDFNMVVYDEGHMLKNSTSERYNKLMRLRAKFRLLLTGTPLQNNLKELVSLLAFMLPNLFNDKREDLQGLFDQKVSAVNNDKNNTFNPLLQTQAISNAKTMMTPFVLRRKKAQVLQHLPQKTYNIIRSTLSPLQRDIYDDNLNQGKKTRAEKERRKTLTGKQAEIARKTPIPSTSNVMMALRKASLHPLLFRTKYTDDKLSRMAKAIMNEPEYTEANKTYILEDMMVMSDYELHFLCQKFPKTMSPFLLKDEDFMESGKVKTLIELLEAIIDNKEKVLIFSLFTQLLDILETVLSISGIPFLRLDGSTSVDTRQDLIDKFYEDENVPVFLLSTKAGGFGINLVAANHVIIFDQSFNPHDDKQAEDRAHRVGQSKEVSVYKLIAEHTIEENILQLAENKLQLDHSISGVDPSDPKAEEKATSLFEKILFDN